MRALLLLPLAACALSGPPEPLSACSGADGDRYDLTGVTVSGDQLLVSLGYGGGCAEHDFVLCWPDPAFAESQPVQTGVEVWHDAHGDSCEAYLDETVGFDLTGLRDAWRDAYQADHGTILVRLRNPWGDVDFDPVEYTF